MMIFMIFMIHTFSPFSYYAPWCPWYPCFLCLLCLRLPRSSRNCSVSICHNLPSVDMWHPMAHGSRYGPARSMPFSHASQFRYLQTFRETLDIRSRRNDDSGRYQIYQMSCIEQMFRCQNRQILGKDKDIADIADIHRCSLWKIQTDEKGSLVLWQNHTKLTRQADVCLADRR